MKSVIYIPEVAPKQEAKPIELTHRKKRGWTSINEGHSRSYLNSAKKVVYLGKCEEDGDMFALYVNGFIMIFKGRLNSGKY